MLPDFDGADRIGEFWGYPKSRAFAELLIDCEEDRTPQGGARRDAAEGGPTAIGHIESPRRMASQWSRRLTTRWLCCNVPNPSGVCSRTV
jgi:hypothetical protein